MRSFCAGLAATVLTSTLLCLAPGCGETELEKPPPTDMKKDVMKDMPGFSKMQDQLKKDGKIK